jgi:hypothetical protein
MHAWVRVLALAQVDLIIFTPGTNTVNVRIPDQLLLLNNIIGQIDKLKFDELMALLNIFIKKFQLL